MMKKVVKNQKGITLISLVITVIILILITGILIYNAKDSIYIRNYSNLENDIQNLRARVSNYYNEYGSVPAKTQVTRISSGIETVFNDLEKQNMGEFYVLDLQVFDGLTLNYGKDYEEVKNSETVTEYYPDLYIINKVTHNIFLLGGIQAKEGNEIKIYYTDYSTPNNDLVDFRYIDGIRIPDGYYYIGRNDEDKIVISPNQTDTIDNNSTTQYVWQQTTEVPQNVNFSEGQTKYEFEQSVLSNGGYYYNQNTNAVIYLQIDSLRPGETKTITITYDANGGIGAPDIQTVTLDSSTKNYTFTLSSTIPTKPGYEFVGWSTSSTAVTSEYKAGDKLELNSSITLYAVWMRHSSGGGAIYYSINVSTVEHGAIKVQKRATKGEVIKVEISPNEGYELDYLHVTNSSGDNIEFVQQSEYIYTFTMPGGGVTIEASFKLIE